MTDDASSWWTEKRERCFKLMLDGVPKSQIARDIKKSRQTVVTWSQHPEFVKRWTEANADIIRTTHQRRIVQTIRMTDKVSDIADEMLDNLRYDPTDRTVREAAFDALREFRALREREDVDGGFNVQQQVVKVEGAVNHQHALANIGFKQFLLDAVRRGAISASSVESQGDERKMLVEMTQQALLDSDVLDKLGEIDAIDVPSEEKK